MRRLPDQWYVLPQVGTAAGFDKNQPRDEKGQWTDTGKNTSSGDPEKTKPAQDYEQMTADLGDIFVNAINAVDVGANSLELLLEEAGLDSYDSVMPESISPAELPRIEEDLDTLRVLAGNQLYGSPILEAVDSLDSVYQGTAQFLRDHKTVWRGTSVENLRNVLDSGEIGAGKEESSYSLKNDVVHTSIDFEQAKYYAYNGVIIEYDTTDLGDDRIKPVDYQLRPEVHMEMPDGSTKRPYENFGGSHTYKYAKEMEVHIKRGSPAKIRRVYSDVLTDAMTKELESKGIEVKPMDATTPETAAGFRKDQPRDKKGRWSKTPGSKSPDPEKPAPEKPEPEKDQYATTTDDMEEYTGVSWHKEESIEKMENIEFAMQEAITDEWMREHEKEILEHYTNFDHIEGPNADLLRYNIMAGWIRDIGSGSTAFQDTKLGKLSKPLFLEQIPELEQIKDATDFYYDDSLRSADSLYRGTTTDELDSLVEHGILGAGGGAYNFVSITTNKKVASDFAVRRYQSDLEVILEFPKEQIEDSLVSQGYQLSRRGDSLSIEEPQGLNFVHELEHRLPDDELPVEALNLKIHIPHYLDDDRKAELQEKYGSLGEIIYWNNKVEVVEYASLKLNVVQKQIGIHKGDIEAAKNSCMRFVFGMTEELFYELLNGTPETAAGFDRNQPRDEKGQWSNTGKKSRSAEPEEEDFSKPAEYDPDFAQSMIKQLNTVKPEDAIKNEGSYFLAQDGKVYAIKSQEGYDLIHEEQIKELLGIDTFREWRELGEENRRDRTGNITIARFSEKTGFVRINNTKISAKHNQLTFALYGPTSTSQVSRIRNMAQDAEMKDTFTRIIVDDARLTEDDQEKKERRISRYIGLSAVTAAADRNYTKFQSKPKKEKRTLQEALLLLGLPAFLISSILFALRNDEDVLDILDENQKRKLQELPEPRKKQLFPEKKKPDGKPAWRKPRPQQPYTEKPKDETKSMTPKGIRVPPDVDTPVIFTTMRDAKVDDLICLPLDYEVFRFGDPERPRIPLDTHPNCRCKYVDAVYNADLGQI